MFVFIKMKLKMPKNPVPQSYVESSGLSPPHSELWVLAFCIWPPFSLQPRQPEDAPSKSRMSQKLQTIRIATRFYCAIRHVRTKQQRTVPYCSVFFFNMHHPAFCLRKAPFPLDPTRDCKHRAGALSLSCPPVPERWLLLQQSLLELWKELE